MSFFSLRSRRFNAFDLLSMAIPLQSWEPFGTPYLNVTFVSLGLFFITVWYNRIINLPELVFFVRKYGIYLIIIWGILIVQTTVYDFEGSVTTYSVPRQMVLTILMFLCVSILIFKDGSYVERFFKWYIVGLLLICASYFLSIGVSYTGGRVRVLGENPNNLAIYFLVGISFLFRDILVYRRFKKIYLLVPLLFVLILTGSRTGFVLLIITPLAIIYFSRISVKNKFKLGGVTLLLGFIVAIFVAFNPLVVERIFEEEVSTDNEFGHRLPIWENALEAWEKNIYWGIGPSGHEYYVVHESGFRGIPRDIHNTFLQVFIYCGIIGFFFFSVLLVKIYRASLYIDEVKKDSYFKSFFLIILVLGITGSWTVNMSIWMVLSIAVGTQALCFRIEKERLIGHKGTASL
jgi:O-antigen ligase